MSHPQDAASDIQGAGGASEPLGGVTQAERDYGREPLPQVDVPKGGPDFNDGRKK